MLETGGWEKKWQAGKSFGTFALRNGTLFFETVPSSLEMASSSLEMALHFLKRQLRENFWSFLLRNGRLGAVTAGWENYWYLPYQNRHFIFWISIFGISIGAFLTVNGSLFFETAKFGIRNGSFLAGNGTLFLDTANFGNAFSKRHRKERPIRSIFPAKKFLMKNV